MKTITLTQREQWHQVVALIRGAGQRIPQKNLSDLCDELDRYIDHAEDIFDEIREEEECGQ